MRATGGSSSSGATARCTRWSNGLFIQQTVQPDEVLLAVVAVGTGNDWVRTFGISNRYQDAVKAIAAGCSFLQDVGWSPTRSRTTGRAATWPMWRAWGFDAHVVRKALAPEEEGTQEPLALYVVRGEELFRYKSTGIKVWVDDRLVYNNLLLSAAVGICKFNGGGMQPLPAAIADDGILDLSLIRPVHFWHLLFRFHYLFNGGSTASVTSCRSGAAGSGSSRRRRSRWRSTASRWAIRRWSFRSCTGRSALWCRRISRG